MEYFVILTCVSPAEAGAHQATITKAIVTDPDTTREALFGWAMSKMPPELAGRSNVTFFSAEPNSYTR
jgi:hypothetical protein